MSQQWGQGQPGYQYPMQTGYPGATGQFQQGFGGGIGPQQTGFPGQRPQFQQPQQTGFPQFQQQTGFQGGFQQQQQPPPVPPLPQNLGGFQQQQAPPPVPPIPQNLSSNFRSTLQPQQQQQPRFLSSSPGLGSHVTGFQGGGGLVPQMTGYTDPRLQMMSSTFMPANPAMPYAPGGVPQFASPGGVGAPQLQQSIQQYNQEQRGTAAPKMPWALAKSEKKNYDQIFRAWDAQNTGFISGQMALEVFGQSGLDKNDLAKIWALADVDNRGKLNIAEFHVAMGLIYRKLNGNEIPDQLPPELVPPSARDLDSSVTLLKSLLQHEPSRATSSSPVSRGKVRSFNGTAENAGTRKDGTVYKHQDDSGGEEYYQSRSRHINRNDVRVGDESPAADLEDMKRQLANTQKMLDKAVDENKSRTAEDEELDREMEDLRYRVKRVKEDLEYAARGPRTEKKVEESRRLERELLNLMHERVPEVERKIEERDRRKEREKREWARDRDRRNERFGRYDDRDRERDRDYGSSRYDYDRERDRERDDDRDRGYNRGTFDREDRSRDHSRDRPYSRNRSRSRDRSRDDRGDYSRRRTPPPSSTRSPPPPPPPAPATSTIANPPPAPVPPSASSPAPPSLKSMTREEREAYIREQARRKLEERMRALGVAPSPGGTSPGGASASGGGGSSAVDSSVEDRLAREKKEAEERSKQAEREAEEREKARRERIERLKAPAATSPTPSPTTTTPKATATPSQARSAPPPAPKRAPAPPPPRKGFGARTPTATSPAVATPPAHAQPAPAFTRAPPAPAPAPPPVAPPAPAEEDPEERRLRERESEMARMRAARAERLRQLEKEEEEARRAEEEYQQRRQAFLKNTVSPTVQSPSVQTQPPPQVSPATPAASLPDAARSATAAAPPPPPPPPPPAPPAPAPPVSAVSPADKSSTNPFSRLVTQNVTPTPTGTTPSSTNANGGTNPFFRAPQPPAISPPPMSSSPISKSSSSYNTAPGLSAGDDDWDDIAEHDDDDSSDDEIAKSRGARNDLAQKIFGGMGIARPQSAAGGTAGAPPSKPGTPAPMSAPPVAAPTPPAPAPPPPPPAPAAPPPPMAPPAPSGPPVTAPAGAPDRSALLGSITAGRKLRKAVTNDRSAASVTGQVLGDTAPPSHISDVPRAVSPPPAPAPPPVPAAPVENSYNEYDDIQSVPLTRGPDSNSSYRQSVDWYAGLAADHGGVAPAAPHLQLPSTAEEKEDDEVYHSAISNVPDIQVHDVAPETNEEMDDVDKSIEHRVRSLYPYDGQRPEDLSFAADLIITAHPSKSGGDWWYGTLVKDGKSGFFPSTYVQVLEHVLAKAVYSYAGGSPEELPFAEGDVLSIIDRSENDWWKTEKGGMIFIVPAAYLEVTEAAAVKSTTGNTPPHLYEDERKSTVVDANLTPDSHVNEPDMVVKQDDDDSSDDEYLSFESESENEKVVHKQSEEDRARERETRALERQRVLEAAGLIVKDDQQALSRKPTRTKSIRSYRPPPEAPKRTSIVSDVSTKDLPPTPEPEPQSAVDSVMRVDDAFERYEAFRLFKDNRLSVSSFDTTPSSPPSNRDSHSAPSLQSTPSRDSESRTYSLLQNWLGRRTPAQDAERPRSHISTPMISGPIPIQNETPARENSPAFGSSWASLVDKEVLDGIPVRERRRQEGIFELINTEAAYVRDLQLIVEVYYSSMLSLLDRKEITVVFANIEELLLTNTAFLSELEELQKQCRLYIDTIGELLSTHMRNMDVYMEYCANHGNAIKILQSLRVAKPELEQHLQRLRDNDPAVRSLDLSSYLLAPMQRITRYPLLIKQILTHTEVESDRQHIETALIAVETTLSQINESIRDQEGRARLKMISQDLWIGNGRLDLTAPTRFLGARKLLKEGVLTKSRSGRKLRGVLCNDIFVLTDYAAKSLYRMPIPLSEVEVRDIAGGRDDLAFRLVMSYPRGGDTINLRATSARDCDLWMKAIRAASERCREVERRAARGSKGGR
ncbi:hypothetical protein BD410DRAFT_497704 [Rickenella mellea]|uniref:Actin cytoskeleton-regulatory complex protein PAN1 n=1 Tax=Rickenella mellea TaxID=50990 RepID=A0A4Y7PTW0_9AGAM|nr:hypothetical protein BD410DRAFT_497704 [Rickenella mellea]